MSDELEPFLSARLRDHTRTGIQAAVSAVPFGGSHDASGTDGVMKKSELGEVVEGAWRCYGRAAALGSTVTPAVPILFFGDVDAYLGCGCVW